MTDTPESCPLCSVDFIGPPLEAVLGQPYDANALALTRVVALVDRDRGRVAAWECPDCGHRWPVE